MSLLRSYGRMTPTGTYKGGDLGGNIVHSHYSVRNHRTFWKSISKLVGIYIQGKMKKLRTSWGPLPHQMFSIKGVPKSLGVVRLMNPGLPEAPPPPPPPLPVVADVAMRVPGRGLQGRGRVLHCLDTHVVAAPTAPPTGHDTCGIRVWLKWEENPSKNL
ncbi:hypothetical protein J6590_052157 [Homalodisca vitripennis]|nr:hypothetical protein J6590_052157 [Homalodisca vitripennis]